MENGSGGYDRRIGYGSVSTNCGYYDSPCTGPNLPSLPYRDNSHDIPDNPSDYQESYLDLFPVFSRYDIAGTVLSCDHRSRPSRFGDDQNSADLKA
jgi:hypothetical protein